MQVKALASKLGVTTDTVRYYSRIGYLNPARNPVNGYKDFGETDENRLRFILSARSLGFSVEDVGMILEKADQGKTPCPLVRELMEERLHEAERLYRETGNLLKRMQKALREWNSTPDKLPTGKHICHLIEQLHSPAEEQHRE